MANMCFSLILFSLITIHEACSIAHRQVSFSLDGGQHNIAHRRQQSNFVTIHSLLIPTLHVQSAPVLVTSGPINIFILLEKAGKYTTFIRLLNQTQTGNQINNQMNNSNDQGMTVFAPTDNAFNNLPAGTINMLTTRQQVQLVQFHVLPKYYTVKKLQTVSNPVRTQATGQDGQVFGLNFTGKGNQVNVSTGFVDVSIYSALRKDFPLAVYQVDKVLLPVEFYQARAPADFPPTLNGTKRDHIDDNKAPDARSPDASPSTLNGTKSDSTDDNKIHGVRSPTPTASPPALNGRKSGSAWDNKTPDAPSPAASPVALNGTKSDYTNDKKTADAPFPANGSGKMSAVFGLVSSIWLMSCLV